MHCGHGIKVGWCVLCTGALAAICQWCGVVCVCVCGEGVGWGGRVSGWGCLSWLRGWLMDQRRIEWTGPHDWYADRIWGAARHPHPSQTYPTTPLEYEREKQVGDWVHRLERWERERGWEVRREWKSVERIDRISAREGGSGEDPKGGKWRGKTKAWREQIGLREGYYSEEMRIITSASEYCWRED